MAAVENFVHVIPGHVPVFNSSAASISLNNSVLSAHAEVVEHIFQRVVVGSGGSEGGQLQLPEEHVVGLLFNLATTFLLLVPKYSVQYICT